MCPEPFHKILLIGISHLAPTIFNGFFLATLASSHWSFFAKLFMAFFLLYSFDQAFEELLNSRGTNILQPSLKLQNILAVNKKYLPVVWEHKTHSFLLMAINKHYNRSHKQNLFFMHWIFQCKVQHIAGRLGLYFQYPVLKKEQTSLFTCKKILFQNIKWDSIR